MTMKHNTYKGLHHDANELSAFLFTIDTFILSLKDGSIIQFKPDNAEAFRNWLVLNKVRDCSKDDGIPPAIKINSETQILSSRGLLSISKLYNYIKQVYTKARNN